MLWALQAYPSQERSVPSKLDHLPNMPPIQLSLLCMEPLVASEPERNPARLCVQSKRMDLLQLAMARRVLPNTRQHAHAMPSLAL